MNLLHLILALLINKVALQYAICTACVVAPLYAFVLKPIARWTRCRAYQGATATQALAPPMIGAATHVDTPVRLTTASAHTFLSPACAGATPSHVTQVSHTASKARAARNRSGSSSSATVTTPARTGSTEVTSLPSPEVTSTALRHPKAASEDEEEHRSPTKRLVSALKHQVQLHSAALFGSNDHALRAAEDCGEAFAHRSALRLPSQDYLALRLLRHHQRHALYNELNITDASLDALYSSSKFQEWYCANREELLRDTQLREFLCKWRNLARATVLLTALMLLPAFSFSTETNALQWRMSLSTGGSNRQGAATEASAPFAQLLLTRMNYIQNARSAEVVAAHALPFTLNMRADVRTFAATALSMAEWVAIVTAVCSLVTSCFMPCGSRRAATVALTAFLVVLFESALVPGVSIRLGLGTLLVATVVGTKIRRATV